MLLPGTVLYLFSPGARSVEYFCHRDGKVGEIHPALKGSEVCDAPEGPHSKAPCSSL